MMPKKQRSTKRVRNDPFQDSPFGKAPSTVSRAMYTVAPLEIDRFLKYETWVGLNPTDGSPNVAYSSFFLNSLYDPEYTATGHQPMGFDQMMGLYNNYTVTDVRIVVRTSGYSVADGDAYTSGVIGITVDDNDTIGSLNSGVLMEYPNTTWTNVNANTIDKTMSRVLDVANYFRLPKRDLVGPGIYSGTANTSPSRGLYAHVWFGDPTSTATLSLMNLFVTLEFRVRFTRPIDLTAS